MKTSKFFLMTGAVIMMLASCSNEEGSDKERSGNGEVTYAGVNITLPAGMGTRAEDADAGIAAEKAVNTIGVYIVDVNSGRFDFELLNVATDFTLSVENNRNVYTATTAVPTVTGTKRVYVVANPTTTLRNELEATGSTGMNPVAFGVAQGAFLTASGSTLTSMVMSGAYTGTGGELDLTAVRTPAEATQAPNLVNVTISRNLSKAVVQQGENYRVSGGTTTLTWTLINKAVDSYFIPQSAGTLYREVPAAALTNDNSGKNHFYWGNFSGMTGTASDYIAVLPYGSGDAKTATYAESKYMFENYPQSLHEGNTTAVRIQGTFVPTTIYGSMTGDDPVETSISSGATFYRSTFDGSYWTEQGAIAAAGAGYAGHTDLSEFVVYNNGVGYYTIWVNDGAGNRGVKRNSYYLLQIDEVRGPGSPTERTDPRPPIDDDTNLGVNVTILNWDYNKSIQDIQ